MDGSTFDWLTRRFAARVSRRGFVAAAAAAALAGSVGRAEAATASEAESLVRQFYELVDAYQYQQAYALLGSAWHKQQSLQSFTSGYASTAFVQCRTTGAQASGSSMAVSVELLSWHNDGQIVAYKGSYTVGTEGGKRRILAGHNTRTTVPSGTPPLCKIADLSFGFGAWTGAAGSRIGSITGRNRSQHTCAVGGSPRVTLTASNGAVLTSTSEPGSAAMAVVLKPSDRAQAPLSFSNWCEPTGTPESVRVEVPGDTAKGNVSTSAHGISYPPCNGPGQSALMAIKGWVRA
jgi:hypothetical protein